MGLNSTLAGATRSLEVFTAGIEVAGHNIANANTPGFIRESLNLTTNTPFRSGNLVFGSGVTAHSIQQEIDLFLEHRIHGANSDAEAAGARDAIYKQLEVTLGELGDGDLSTRLNDFLAAIHEVVNQPELAEIRLSAVQQGRQLAGGIAAVRHEVDELREAQADRIASLISEANQLISVIDDLNPRISKLEIGGLVGSDAGALRTQRYVALNRLSEIIPIRFQERQDGTVDVFSGSDYLVLAGQTQQLETITSADRGVPIQTVRFSQSKSLVTTESGELQGIISARDNILGGFVDHLDAYASHLIAEFNGIHASGEGLRGFTSVVGQSSAADSAAALNAAGLAFAPEHGSFQIKVTNKLTGITNTTTISIDLDGIGSDTTLDSLQAALDAVSNVSASVTADRRLQLDANPNFEIRFANDTSGALAALGVNTFFTGTDSRTIGVNPFVEEDHGLFAASRGDGPSDGRNAVALAEFIDHPVDGLGGVSLDSYYNSIVFSIAQSSAAETAIATGIDGFRESLFNQRSQFSGVSLDEEAIQILEFQKSFQAAARVISTVDELFTILLNI